MTQREQFGIAKAKNDTYKAYFDFLVRYNEVPREEILTLIEGCTSIEAFQKVIKIISKK
ncbi:MAG: hypothetical protein Wins2KO_04060 [Winogradskyella sp.]